MSKAHFNDVFNRKFLEFLRDFSNQYPHDNAIADLKSGANMLITMSPKTDLPQKLFSKYAEGYKEHIVNRNDEFFMNHDFSDEINEGQGTVENIESIVVQIKSYWNTMPDGNKDAIWKYMELLMKLSDKCNELSG